MTVDTYACSNELQSTTHIDGIGTICHEFSHCLGLPDLYDVLTGEQYGTGTWDAMCSGSYNGNSFSPAAYSAYERMASGWIRPVELIADTAISSMKELNEDGEAYIVYNDANRNEYYLLENRQQQGWDAALPGAGMLITHIDYDPEIWKNNIPNSIYEGYNDHQRCALVLADNIPGDETAHGDAYPFGENNLLTNTSTPKASLFTPNIDGTKLLNKNITHIMQNDDSTMSFSFTNENEQSGINEENISETGGKDNRIFSVDGRYLGNDPTLLDKGIYITNGKKYVK